MRDGKEGVAFAVNTPGGHARMLSNGNGVCIGKEPADAEGFASMFNNGKSPANRITADNVKVLSDGNFRVRKNGRESFYAHPCPLPAGLVAATENFTATTRPEISWNCRIADPRKMPGGFLLPGILPVILNLST